MEEVDDIRKKKVSAELEYRNSMPASSYQQQKLRVCEICSAYLGIHDNDRRLADHFGGKLHLGFIKIREKLDGLLVSLSKFYHLWAITDVGRTRIPKLYACLILSKLRVCEFVRPIWVWCDILINKLTKSSSRFSWILIKPKYSLPPKLLTNLPRETWQRSTIGRSFWRQTSFRLYQNSRKAGGARGKCFIKI